MAAEPALTITDVAEMLQVAESTVRALINNRELEAFKVGKNWRVLPSNLDKYIAAAHEQAQAELPQATKH